MPTIEKVELINGKKTLENSRALEARIVKLEAKTDNSSNESLFSDEKPKANSGIYPTLIEWEAEPERAAQTLDGLGH